MFSGSISNMDDNNNSQLTNNQTTNQSASSEPAPSTVPDPVQEPVVTSNKPRRKLWPFILLLVLAVVAAAGAFLISRPDESKTITASKQDVPLIRYGSDYAPLNVFYPETGLISSQTEINNQIFEGLVKYEGLSRVVPSLATGWSNPDTSTWLFDIKPNVKFHNGKKMTTADVKASLDYMIENQEKLENPTASSIKSVELVGSGQVKIVTDGPDPVLLNKLASLFIFDASGESLADPANGTGPYNLKPGTTPSDKRLELVAFDNWHGGKVHTRSLQFVSQPVEDSIKDLQAGKLDIVINISDEDLAKVKGYPTFLTPNPFVFFIGINSLKEGSPLQKKAVRQAISLAIDRPTLSKSIGGEAINQVIPPSIPGFNPDIAVPKRDVAKAKQLLTEAGYKDGVTLELTYTPAREALIQNIIKQLADVGINIKANPIDNDDVYYETSFSGATDLFYIAYGSDYLDGADVLGSTITMDANYVNDEVTAGLKDIANEMDASTRLKALQKMSKIAADDVAVVPISSSVQTTVLSKKYNLTADSPNTITGINFYKVTQD